jgi:hypothetical protein
MFLTVNNRDVTAREEKQDDSLIMGHLIGGICCAGHGGVLLGGFTATVWYHVGPLVAGLYLLPAFASAVVLGAVAEFIYRAFIRPRQHG